MYRFRALDPETGKAWNPAIGSGGKPLKNGEWLLFYGKVVCAEAGLSKGGAWEKEGPDDTCLWRKTFYLKDKNGDNKICNLALNEDGDQIWDCDIDHEDAKQQILDGLKIEINEDGYAIFAKLDLFSTAGLPAPKGRIGGFKVPSSNI